MIIYIHGFLSSGKGFKPMWFANKFAQSSLKFHAASYSQKSPLKSIRFFEELIEKHLALSEPVLLIGSSLGGYFSFYLAQKYNLPFVLINPVSIPIKLFEQYKGKHENQITGEIVQINEQFNKELLSFFNQQPKPMQEKGLVLLDKEDEVIPYQTAVKFFKELAEVRVFEGGSHSFEHLDEAWCLIKDKFKLCNDPTPGDI